ncbi:MAG: right-handed parallel beta-helix repeat-containing protein [Planctomycetaceae bacterium]|nr:right-handed parallel beta-helix repeat-containing protein [Planctomycetaceae bacterium]
MKTVPCHFVLVFLLLVSVSVAGEPKSMHSASILVAAQDASESVKENADFVCDGVGDQEEICRAILALPEAGGTVSLSAGTFDIRHVPETLGGILIDRSHVTLAGQGAATKLIQAADQNTNVIRIIGSDVGYITIRDLYIDANRDENQNDEADPNVSHARFEFCGIKAFYTYPGGPTGVRNHHITVENCHVLNARRLGIMLEGSYMKVINNHLSNANSDVVEILTGPGEIRGNHFEITGATHVAVGSDRADNMIMAENIVHVRKGADLDIGFRSWANSNRHVIANNILTVDEGGHCDYAMDVRGNGATVTGNSIHSANAESRLPLWITGGNTVVSGNLFENVELVIEDKTELQKPILVHGNIFDDSIVTHKQGRLQEQNNIMQSVAE